MKILSAAVISENNWLWTCQLSCKKGLEKFSLFKIDWRVYQGDRDIDGAFGSEISLARPVPDVASAWSCASDNTGVDPAVQKESTCFI